MHPMYAALSEAWVPASMRGVEAMKMLARLLLEVLSGQRHFPDAVAERMLELDAEQRANGCPDENLGNLIELLRERHGPRAA